MAELTLHVAGRDHLVICRDGEEAQLRKLGAMLEMHAETAMRASAGNPDRTLLYIALILADELDEMQRNPAAGVPRVLLDRIADRLEAVASALEESVPAA